MNLPKSFFDPESKKLTVVARENLKDFFKAQELSKINDLVGFTPHPDRPWPCPPPWYSAGTGFNSGQSLRGVSALSWPERILNLGPQTSGNYGDLGKPDPNDPYPWPWPIGPWIRQLMLENIFERVQKSPIKGNPYNFFEVVKRENIALEALSELQENLSVAQNTIAVRLKKLD